MSDWAEKIGELTGKFRSIEPLLDTLGKNVADAQKLGFQLQRDMVHLEKEIAKFQGRYDKHWERIYKTLNDKVDCEDRDKQE